MDLNFALSTTPSELFDDNDVVFPILMGRENLKILASPGSESSGVSSLDADEAKKLVSEQLPTSNSPTMSSSEPSSAVQTESESSDGGSDGDDERPTEQIPQNVVDVQMVIADELQQSNISIVSTITMSTLTMDDDDQSNDIKSEISMEKCDENEHSEAQIDQLVSADDAKITASVHDEDAAAMAAAIAAANDLNEEIRYSNLKIMYDGRNILDFSANVANKSWNVQYAHLPEKNIEMYINNRSQYNRLASGYEGPENYALSKCNFCKCKFEYPVLNFDVPTKVERPQRFNNHVCTVNDLLTSTVSSMVTRDSPTQTLNALAQKLAAQSPMILNKNPNAQFMHHLKNAVPNVGTNANQSVPPFPYQNRNQCNQFANVGATSNNHTCYKHANNNTNGNANNAFYGNNISLNALVNQIGGNTMNNSTFNSMLLSNNSTTVNTNTAATNQLNNAALATFIQQNRQQLFNYGACRQNNINKSGINFNANSHKPMPTYSHF
ncbi:probable cyclin-dependent serine/threonine-protein kinase DDB_G0292550 [Contarinia nasturtii]|uniref:probable cyclin-dependent serine/threonine-protein kinase DDB_G0292550 n=1 Tax=Contarinia nasturtii TaxID=265458 RepID=UPI0012D47FF1|nr:probable cyclin-dependent serine/threonine-protein kinase DDB_G0292550 [Contarinia nasturtii]